MNPNSDSAICKYVKYGNEISTRKLANACNNYASGLLDDPAEGEEKDILVALIDATVFRSGKEGMLFTTKYLYCSDFRLSPEAEKINTGHGMRISIENIVKSEKVDQKLLTVHYADKSNIIVRFATDYIDVLNSILNDIAQFDANNK